MVATPFGSCDILYNVNIRKLISLAIGIPSAISDAIIIKQVLADPTNPPKQDFNAIIIILAVMVVGSIFAFF